MKIVHGAAAPAVLALMLSACAQLPGPSPTDSAEVPTADAEHQSQEPTTLERALSPEQRSRLYYHILLAQLAEAKGEYAIAYQNYLHAAKASGRPELARSAAIAAERGEDPAGSLVAARLWADADVEDLDARELLAIGYLRQGQSDEAYTLLREIVAKLKTRGGNILRELMRVVETEPKPATLSALGRLADEAKDSDVSLAAAHLALRLRDWPELERRADESLALKPDRPDAIKLKVFALQSQERTAEALSFLEALRVRQPDDRELSLTAGQLLLRLNKPDEARALYEGFLKAHPGDNEMRFALAGLAYDQEDYEASRQHFETVAAAGLHTEIALYYLGEIAARQNETSRALAYFRQVNGGRFQLEAKLSVARLLAQAGQLDAALTELHGAAAELPERRLELLVAEIDLLRDGARLDAANKLLKQGLIDYPANVQLLLAQAQLASIQDDYALTQTALEQALAQVESPEIRKQLILAGSEVLRGAGQVPAAMSLVNRGLSSHPEDTDLLYARAILAETMNRPDISEKDLRSILARDPDNATALNALGYSLADRNLRLTEAASLLEKAHTLTPNDPAVIDSLGWLYYRRGELREALEYLRRAYSLNDDPEIAAHLGEVLWQSGDKPGARAIWDKALKKDPEHRALKQVLEKFKP